MSKKEPKSGKHWPSSGVFKEYARYYDLLYQDKDYQSEANYVSELIHRYHPEPRAILELGSGTGIHASLLAKKGFEVYGVELSSQMLNRSPHPAEITANSRIGHLRFKQGDIRIIRINKKFDATISLFHVVSYQITNDDLIATFQTAREHLKTGGIFIFDVWYGPAVLTMQPDTRIKRMSDEKTEITRLAEPVLHPNQNLVQVNYHIFVRDLTYGTIREVRETHTMRYFFKPEIEIISSQTGFRFIHAEEWLTKAMIGVKTWGVSFVLLAS